MGTPANGRVTSIVRRTSEVRRTVSAASVARNRSLSRALGERSKPGRGANFMPLHSAYMLTVPADSLCARPREGNPWAEEERAGETYAVRTNSDQKTKYQGR